MLDRNATLFSADRLSQCGSSHLSSTCSKVQEASVQMAWRGHEPVLQAQAWQNIHCAAPPQDAPRHGTALWNGFIPPLAVQVELALLAGVQEEWPLNSRAWLKLEVWLPLIQPALCQRTSVGQTIGPLLAGLAQICMSREGVCLHLGKYSQISSSKHQ